MDFSNIKEITIPEGTVKSIAIDGTTIWSKEKEPFNLFATATNKGFRTTSNNISGNGTDPNWVWGEKVQTEGYTKISYNLWGYTTVAGLMFYDVNNRPISNIHATGSVYITDEINIPTNAYYVAISCGNPSIRSGQYAIMS